MCYCMMLTVTLFDVINFFFAYRTILYVCLYLCVAIFNNNILFRLITLHILNKLYPLSYYRYYYTAAKHLGGCHYNYTTTVRLIIIII